jgi:hypothetical protein
VARPLPNHVSNGGATRAVAATRGKRPLWAQPGLFAPSPASGTSRHPNHRATTVWHTARTLDDHSPTPRHADRLLTAVASVESSVEVIMERVARLAGRDARAPQADGLGDRDAGEDERARS